MGHFGAPQKGTVCTLDGKNAFMVKYYCVLCLLISVVQEGVDLSFRTCDYWIC